jgi:hypothetical protein
MIYLAHAGHWITGIGYFSPVVVFLGWLLIVRIRDRRERKEKS